MPSVWLSKYSRWIEALLNAKGGPALVDVDPSLRAVIAVQEGNEDRYLQGWNRYGAYAPVAAVAANFGQAQIRNPAASNVMVVVESLIATDTAGTDAPTLTWGATVSDLATIVSLAFSRLDPRGNPQPTAIVSSTAGGTNLAVFQQLGTNSTLPNAQFVPTVNCEFTVLPGQILKVFSNLANQAIAFSFLWRERALQQSELT